jgi:hypothetical protein
MLGRPRVVTPVFIINCPGWWLNDSVCIERTRQMSSAHLPRCGSRSDSSMPHAPCFVNFLGLPRMRAVAFWRKAKRTFFVIDSGIGLPCSALSFGLGSKRSSWLGPPSR